MDVIRYKCGRGRTVILITTSRRPTKRIRALCRDLALSIPNAIRVNRGKSSLDGVAERAIQSEANRVIIVNRWRGGPGKIDLFHAGAGGLTPVSPILYAGGVRLQREFGIKARSPRSIVLTTPSEGHMEIAKITGALSNFLRVPVLPLKDATSRYPFSMHVSLGASGLAQITFLRLPEVVEIGPRITLSSVGWET